MLGTSQTLARLVCCLLLSGGLHASVATLEWQGTPSRARVAGQPLEVTLNTITVSQESNSSRRLPAPQTTLPRSQPKPVAKPVAVKKRQPRPVRKPLVKKKPVDPPVEKQVVVEPVVAVVEPVVPEPVSPLPDQTSFDLMSRLKPLHEKAAPDKELIATSQLSGTAGSSSLSSVKAQVDTVAKGNDVESDAKPMYWDNPLPDYPLQARRRHWEGTVWLRVEVSAKGEVVDLELEKTSGYRVLDRSAEKAVRFWKFQPAKRAGIPVSCRVRVPVRFQLDQS